MAADTTAEFNDDIFDSMVNGTFEPEAVEEIDEVADETDTEDSVGSEHEEDTDQEEETETEEQPDDDRDGDDDEDFEEEDDDEEENALVEDYDIDDEDIEDDEEDEPSEDDEIDESEDETDTEAEPDGEQPATDKVDYKAFYEAVVNAEFTANGKKVKGFADPQKIIQSQQMAAGFSEKMAGFKQYRPFMSPLKERGMLEDQAKFDLAMNIIDGDKEAIKQHLATLDIDPLDLDMEAISYNEAPQAIPQETLIVEDFLEKAKGAGVEDKVRNIVGNEWDADSFQEFLQNDAVRSDLLNHIETGAYEQVQDKIAEISRLDIDGTYSGLKSIDKYRHAVRALQNENAAKQGAEAAKVVTPKPVVKKASVAKEKAKILESRKAAEYEGKVAKKNAKTDSARKRAASLSKRKPKAKAKEAFDPMKVEGEDLDNLMDFLIEGDR